MGDGGRAAGAPSLDAPRLVLRVPPAGAATDEQSFASACARLLPKAAASGDRLATALYLILVAHAAAVPGGPGVAATCAECRPERREPAGRYPCPTAQQAFWALDATLR